MKMALTVCKTKEGKEITLGSDGEGPCMLMLWKFRFLSHEQ